MRTTIKMLAPIFAACSSLSKDKRHKNIFTWAAMICLGARGLFWLSDCLSDEYGFSRPSLNTDRLKTFAVVGGGASGILGLLTLVCLLRAPEAISQVCGDVLLDLLNTAINSVRQALQLSPRTQKLTSLAALAGFLKDFSAYFRESGDPLTRIHHYIGERSHLVPLDASAVLLNMAASLGGTVDVSQDPPPPSTPVPGTG